MISKKTLSLKRQAWEKSGEFIIGFDSIRNCYGVWEREPLWSECNPISEFFLTIEEARQYVNNLS